jgi:hypothetical protein
MNGTYGSDWIDGWEAVGIAPAEAERWVRAGYRPNEARDWRSVGAHDSGTAAEWERCGFTPSTAAPWLVIAEIGPADAITMSEAGMTPAECARIRARDPRCAIDEIDRLRVDAQPPGGADYLVDVSEECPVRRGSQWVSYRMGNDPRSGRRNAGRVHRRHLGSRPPGRAGATGGRRSRCQLTRGTPSPKGMQRR